MSSEQYDKAAELFSELILRSPERVSAIASRGAVSESLGDPDSAFTDYRVVVGLDPTADLTYIDLARISNDRGELESGARYIEQALEIDPDTGFVQETLAYNLIKRGIRSTARGDAETARQLFERAETASRRGLELDPKLLWTDVLLANSLVERNRLLDSPDANLIGDALTHYRRTLTRWPTPPATGQARNLNYV